MNKEELLKAYKEKDEECDKLIEKSPMGWHDKEFEELVLLKSKLEGYEMAEEDFKNSKGYDKTKEGLKKLEKFWEEEE